MSKSLVKNAGLNVVHKLLNIVFPLITAMYISRILSPKGVGEVAYAQNIMTYFLLLASLGIPNYGIREVAKTRDNQEQNQKIFSELFVINLISTAIFAGMYYLFIRTTDAFRDNIALHYIVGINLVFNVFNVEWFYQGHEEYSYITKRSFFIKIVALLCVLIFVKSPDDINWYALISVLGIVGNYVFNFIHLRKYIKFRFDGLNLAVHMKPILVLFASIIAIELYTLLDTTMLGVCCTEAVVGYYTNSVKMVKIITTFIAAIGTVLLPRLSYYREINNMDGFHNAINTTVKILIWLTSGCAVGLFLTADNVVIAMFGEEFVPAVSITRILCILIIALALNNFFGTQILITIGKEKLLLISVICGALSNVALNLYLIPNYGADGAAFASAFSEVLVLILTYIFAKKFITIKIERGFIISVFISLALMILGVIVVKASKLYWLLSLAIEILVGGCCYVLASTFTRNEVLLYVKQFITKKDTF